MTGQKSRGPRTLMEAHELLSGQRPGGGASREMWLAYYRRSVAIYAEIAETDRGHHHEALYWAGRERRRAEELARGGSPAVDCPPST